MGKGTSVSHDIKGFDFFPRIFSQLKKMRCKLFIYVGLKQVMRNDKWYVQKRSFPQSQPYSCFDVRALEPNNFFYCNPSFASCALQMGWGSFFFRRWPPRWGYHSSTFTNTLGREKILIALSISDSFFSSSAFVVFTRSVSTLTGSAFNWARSSVWSEREMN